MREKVDHVVLVVVDVVHPDRARLDAERAKPGALVKGARRNIGVGHGQHELLDAFQLRGFDYAPQECGADASTVRATVLQLASGVASAVKPTVPEAALPVTRAVKVTVVPATAGLPELDSAVVVLAGALGVPVLQASTSAMRDSCGALVMLIRMRSVV